MEVSSSCSRQTAFLNVKRLVKRRLLDGCTRRIPRNVTGHVTVLNTGWHGCDWLCAITDATCGPENRVVNMETSSKCTQIQPKRAIMAYGLPKQLSGAVGRTKHNKKPLGSDFFGCWSRVVFANRHFSACPAKVGLASKKNPFPVMGRKELICWSEVDLSVRRPRRW